MVIILDNQIIRILLIFFVSFICAFSKEFNSYAKNPYKRNSLLIFISQVLLSGVCGMLIGLLATTYTDNIYIIIFISGAAGIIGSGSIRIVIRVLLSLRNINISENEINKDFEEDNDDYRPKKHSKHH